MKMSHEHIEFLKLLKDERTRIRKRRFTYHLVTYVSLYTGKVTQEKVNSIGLDAILHLDKQNHIQVINNQFIGLEPQAC